MGIDYVQADVVLTADCTCHSRPAVQAKKRPRRQKQAVAAASDADDASDDNEDADDVVEEEEDGDASAWIQPKDLDKLEMVAVWNRMRGEATSDECFNPRGTTRRMKRRPFHIARLVNNLNSPRPSTTQPRLC